MRLKRLIILFLLISLPVIIYITNIDNKIYYLSLGDSLAAGQDPYGNIGYGYSDYVKDYLKSKKQLEFYTKKYAVSGYRTTDLIREMEKKKKTEIGGREITIKNALTKADIITLSIGANDLLYKLGTNFIFEDEQKIMDYVEEVINDIEKLLILLKKYCNEDIILVGYYNPLWQINSTLAIELDPIFSQVNQKMKEVATKHNIYFVDVYKVFKENKDFLPNPLDIHPSTKGYEAMAREILKIIDKNILN
jgi:lysophospholipase L1-like esterase